MTLRYGPLWLNLVRKDLRLKYQGSWIGVAWSLVNPLVLLAVYGLTFTYIIPLAIPRFVLFLLVGLVHWNLFAQTAVASAGSIVDNASLLRKVRFPAEVLPLATVGFYLAQYACALVVLLPAAYLGYGVRPGWGTLGFLPLLGLQVAYMSGIAFFLSAATVRSRDVRHFVEVAVLVLFWLTPVIYEVRTLGGDIRRLIALNPLTPLMLGYQAVLFRGESLPAHSWVAPVAWAALLLGGGWAYFRRQRWRFPEDA